MATLDVSHGQRDPERIDRILELVRERWREHPEMRLGQLIVNFARPLDAFYFEDDEMERSLFEGWNLGPTVHPKNALGI